MRVSHCLGENPAPNKIDDTTSAIPHALMVVSVSPRNTIANRVILIGATAVVKAAEDALTWGRPRYQQVKKVILLATSRAVRSQSSAEKCVLTSDGAILNAIGIIMAALKRLLSVAVTMGEITVR